MRPPIGLSVNVFRRLASEGVAISSDLYARKVVQVALGFETIRTFTAAPSASTGFLSYRASFHCRGDMNGILVPSGQHGVNVLSMYFKLQALSLPPFRRDPLLNQGFFIRCRL